MAPESDPKDERKAKGERVKRVIGRVKFAHLDHFGLAGRVDPEPIRRPFPEFSSEEDSDEDSSPTSVKKRSVRSAPVAPPRHKLPHFARLPHIGSMTNFNALTHFGDASQPTPEKLKELRDLMEANKCRGHATFNPLPPIPMSFESMTGPNGVTERWARLEAEQAAAARSILYNIPLETVRAEMGIQAPSKPSEEASEPPKKKRKIVERRAAKGPKRVFHWKDPEKEKHRVNIRKIKGLEENDAGDRGQTYRRLLARREAARQAQESEQEDRRSREEEAVRNYDDKLGPDDQKVINRITFPHGLKRKDDC